MWHQFQLKLYLIRHGETAINKRQAFQGRIDMEHTPEGQAQVEALSAKLTDLHLDHVFSSPLKRAQATATALIANRPLKIELEPRLIEQDFGVWDGLKPAEAQDKYAESFNRWRDGTPDLPPEGGESLVKVADRVYGFYRETLENKQGQSVAFVGHGSAFQALLCRIFKVPLSNRWPFLLHNGTLTEVVVRDSGPVLTRLSWE